MLAVERKTTALFSLSAEASVRLCTVTLLTRELVSRSTCHQGCALDAVRLTEPAEKTPLVLPSTARAAVPTSVDDCVAGRLVDRFTAPVVPATCSSARFSVVMMLESCSRMYRPVALPAFRVRLLVVEENAENDICFTEASDCSE